MTITTGDSVSCQVSYAESPGAMGAAYCMATKELAFLRKTDSDTGVLVMGIESLWEYCVTLAAVRDGTLATGIVTLSTEESTTAFDADKGRPSPFALIGVKQWHEVWNLYLRRPAYHILQMESSEMACRPMDSGLIFRTDDPDDILAALLDARINAWDSGDAGAAPWAELKGSLI